MNKSNTNLKTNHQPINTLTFSTITDGTSIILELKQNLLEKMVITILESYSTQEALQLKKHLKNKTQSNNNNKVKTISMMITVKSPFISTKMVNQNGCVPNSLSLNKIQKLQVLDSLITLKLKELIDSKKEIQVLLIQDLKFIVLKKLLVIKLDNLLKVQVLITLYFKMLQISVLHMNINSIQIGLKI